MEVKPVRFESFWTRHSGWLCLSVVVLVSFVGYWLDRLLVSEGISRNYMLMVSNSITGVVVGIFFFQMLRHERAHRELVRERVKTIAELNHHIRNALEVIKLCGTQAGLVTDARPLQMIKESADRIEWALREVLPRYPADEAEIERHDRWERGVAAAPVSIRCVSNSRGRS